MSRSITLRQLCTLIITSVIFVSAGDAAWAQVSRAPRAPQSASGSSRQRNIPSRRNTPTVSPYLSLINSAGNGSNIFNFYNIVRPQRRAQRMASQLGNELRHVENTMSMQQLTNANQSQSTLQTDQMPSFAGRMEPTGHATAFGDLQGFYADYGDPR